MDGKREHLVVGSWQINIYKFTARLTGKQKRSDRKLSHFRLYWLASIKTSSSSDLHFRCRKPTYT
jgi:hypothetical protein